MPKKKPLEVSKEFVEQVLSIIANESEEGRKKIVAIARRGEKKYEQPVKSWITGWFYQYTRTRGEKVEQSINVMENFPDAYTRLQEFKLMISEGEWKVGSYNYYLFLELIDAVPDYQPLEEQLIHTFVMELKEQVILQINSFMTQYKSTLEDIKSRELERQVARQNARQLVENVLVFNNLSEAKKYQIKSNEKIVFSLTYEEKQWHLSWVDVTGEIYPLNSGDELVQKLGSLDNPDVEKLNSVHLRQVKRECLKAREQYLVKVQLLINPEDPKTHTALSNEELLESGVTSTFVLRRTQNDASLWWFNSMGVPNQISWIDHPKLESWLSDHPNPLNEANILQFKSQLLQVKTAQSIATSKLTKMNSMLAHVFQKKEKPHQRTADEAHTIDSSVGKLNLKRFEKIEQHMKERFVSQTGEKATINQEIGVKTAQEKNAPKKLDQTRYSALSQLPVFWQEHQKMDKSSMELSDTPAMGQNSMS